MFSDKHGANSRPLDLLVRPDHSRLQMGDGFALLGNVANDEEYMLRQAVAAQGMTEEQMAEYQRKNAAGMMNMYRPGDKYPEDYLLPKPTKWQRFKTAMARVLFGA
jgi:hypothetical protein